MVDRTEKEIILRAVKDGAGFEETAAALRELESKARDLEKVFKAGGMSSKEYEEQLKKLGVNAKDTTSSAGGLASVFSSLLPALSAAALIGAFKAITDSAIESERESRILGQTIKNLGLESEVTITSVEDFAKKMQALAGVSDEQVVRSFNDLLKVTKDSKASFELVKLAMDMAAGSGKSLEETSNVLMMAIQGQTRGLKQYGIEVAEGTDLVTALEKATKNYAGMADKMGESTEGSLKKSAEAFDNLKETAGRVFLPIMGWFANLTTKCIEFTEVIISNMILKFKEFGNIVRGVFDSIVSRDFKKFQAALKENEKLEAEQTKNIADMYKKQSEKKEKLVVDFSKLKDLHAAKDVEREKDTAAKIEKIQEEEFEKLKKQYEADVAADEAAEAKKVKAAEDAEGKVIESNKRIGESFRNDIVDKIVSGSLDIGTAISDLAKAMLKTLLQDALIPIGEAAAGVGGALRNAFSGGGGGAIGEAVGSVGGAVGSVGGAIGGALGAAVPVVGAALLGKALVDTLAGALFGSEVTPAQAAAKQGITEREWFRKNGFKNIGETIAMGIPISQELFNEMITESSASGRPMEFAKGGIVTKPTLAMVGEEGPEAIIPLNKGNGLNKTEVHLHVGAMMGTPADALAFAKMVDVQLRKISRRDLTV